MQSVVQRVVSGTPGLDRMLHGGLLSGRMYVIVGPPGSGKTILAVQFLLEGVKRGENVLLVALDEPPSEIRENLGAMFGSNFDKIRVLDANLETKSYQKTPVRDVSIQRYSESFDKVFPEIPRSTDSRNPELTASAVQEMIKTEVMKNKINRIVIDSMTSLKCFLMPEGDQNQFMQSFFRFLSDLQVTTIVTIQEGESSNPLWKSCCIEDVMARGVIRLHKWLQHNGFKTGISIEKFRGSDHDTRIRRIKLTSIGLQILDRHGPVKGGG